MTWTSKLRRIENGQPTDDLMAIWEGTNQNGQRIRVYVKRIESIDDNGNVIND